MYSVETFHATRADIEYRAECDVDIPWGVDAHGTSEEIIVLGVRDLNEEIETLEKGEASEEFKVGCMCWAEGPVTSKVTIPKTGFVCGERVKVTVHVSVNLLQN